MLAAASLLVFLAGPARADEKEAESCLRTKVWDGYAEGWGVRTMTSTSIPNGKTRNYLVTLYEGNAYKIQTCADETIENLDLLLYDTKGNVIARDTTRDRQPEVAFQPTATGTYYIVLYNRESARPDQLGGAAMAVVYR
ncbi:MAG: hypothetical protein ABMB14_24670 [Myxococcota bacterium]